MNDEPKTMSPRRLAQVIRREAWLVGVVMILAIFAAAAVTAVQTPMYRAKMSLVVGQTGGAFQPEIGSPTITQTVTTLLQSEDVASQVIDELRLDTTPEKLAKKLKVLVRPNSAVVEISIDADSTSESERILGQYATVFLKEIKRLGFESDPAKIGETEDPIIYATVFNRPRADPKAVSPRKGAAIFTAALLGLIIGMVLAFVRERLDDRIRSRQEAEEAFGAPVIGGLPVGSGRTAPSLDASQQAGSRRVEKRQEALEESLQLLSLNLELIDEGRGGSILVTSTQPEEGKTTLVANLAVALARAGHHVICVEADPVRPSLSSMLGIRPPAKNGAGDHADLPLDRLLQRVAIEPGSRSADFAGDVRVLSFDDWQEGVAAHGPKDRGATLVSTLRASADYVIFDSSPLTIGNASRLALLTDRVLVVARTGHATHSRAETTRAVLKRLGVKRVSVVMTEADLDPPASPGRRGRLPSSRRRRA